MAQLAGNAGVSAKAADTPAAAAAGAEANRFTARGCSRS